MGGGSTTQDTSSQNTNTTQLPPWVNSAAQQNYALAQDAANRPLTQFQGQQVADTAPQTQQAWNLAATSGGAGADQYNASQAGYLTAAGYQPNQITPQTLAGTNLSAYQNPFTQSVINSTIPIMQQANALTQNQQANQANSANAFGGSRQGVQQGVAQAQGAQNIGQMAAQLNQANYQQATQGAQYDITNNMNAQQQNAANQQGAVNSLLQASTGLAGLGTQAQTNQRQQFLEQSTAGAQEQQQAQNQIAAQMNQFNQANNYPTTQLGILQSALGMTPYGSSSSGASSGQQTTTTNPSIGSDIFGGLQSLGGMFGSGGPFNSMLTNALNPGSDRHLKTDITKVGVHQPSGLPMYSYRYKGDPKTYPKVTGPMAEDAMQVAPHAVKTVGVHAPTGQALHTVDMNALNATPAIRPRRMPGANGSFTTRVPGALAPVAPTGVMGAMGANMRAPRMRPNAAMPRVPGAMMGGGLMSG
jgi:hypothetical protein